MKELIIQESSFKLHKLRAMNDFLRGIMKSIIMNLRIFYARGQR